MRTLIGAVLRWKRGGFRIGREREISGDPSGQGLLPGEGTGT